MSQIDGLHFLEQVVRQNTQHYQSDFDYDRRTLTQAAQAVDMADRVFCWMSRPAGTWCVKEREVFLRGSGAHSIWTYYAEEPEHIKAYRITIAGIEDGKVMGAVYPLNYAQQVRRVQAQALPATAITLQYENGHTITVPYGEYRKAIATILPGHGGIQKVRYEPESEAELTRTLMVEHRIQTGKYKKSRNKSSGRLDR